jgi:hypothetical protein
LCRNGQYFERLRDISKPKTADELIFTVDNANELSKRTLLYHWHKMIELADIADREVRDLVPYSLRHFMITQRIMSGLTFRQIADMCGTSVAQIEKTYYHLNDEIRLTNAVADYRRNEDGHLFKKHIEFEKGRQTRNPNRSNARYSLSKPIAIDSLQTAFALYDLIEQAETEGTKVNNYVLAKQVGIEVEQRNTEEEWDVAYKRRVVSVAVSRKKKVAVDAISNVVKGVFP